MNPYFFVTPTKFETKTPLTFGNNYGAKEGIYSHQNPEIARAKCLTGLELKLGEYSVDVDQGVLFTYDCTLDETCNVLPVVG